MTRRTTTLTAIALLMMGALFAPAAQAKYVAIFEEVDSNVVEVGGGAIDLTDLTQTPAVNTLTPSIAPTVSQFISGAAGAQGQIYRDLIGPRSFGTGDPANADLSSGDGVELSVNRLSNKIEVPVGYVSDSPLSETSTYLNATFASLGLTPGAYVYSWGSGDHADSFTIVIGAPVPEPSTWAMGLIGFAGLGYAAMRRKGAVRPISARQPKEGASCP
ncbi:MAG TPA: PEP-CTERM sorting domain-containing protein [Roseiarcus sp.]|jgi:hypothetical protein|nr:PEP-CTERM sorting domain-containing protein [Roseiarcus sp.]